MKICAKKGLSWKKDEIAILSNLIDRIKKYVYTVVRMYISISRRQLLEMVIKKHVAKIL